MKTLDRVIEYCDRWYPVGAEYEALARRVRAADRAARQFDKIDLAVAVVNPSEESCERLRDLGFSHLVLGIASEPRDKALAALNRRASLASKLRWKMGPLVRRDFSAERSHAARSYDSIDGAAELSGKSLIP